MAAFLSNNQPRLGALNLAPLVELPQLPNIIAEWAAVIPLVCHLASNRSGYTMTGEIALLGHVGLGIFPKLGTLSGLSRLLYSSPEFFDEVSTRGGATCTVWDVRWGSVFPCANGAASHFIKAFLRHHRASPAVHMPETLPPSGGEGDSTPRAGTNTKDTIKCKEAPQSKFRRHQVLHILHFRPPTKQRSRKVQLLHPSIKFIYAIAIAIVLSSLATTLAICGAYGTAAQVLCSVFSHLIAKKMLILRPPGYLESNEAFQEASMLLAPHQNAQEWTLFMGDRGVIDTLLNKAMIVVPKCRVNKVAAAWFRAAHIFQLLAMTFAAGQKGWDGVLLVILMVADFAYQWRFRGMGLAKAWIADAGIRAEAHMFLFSSRTIMLGAIEKFRGCKRTIWMDQILPPHPRRDAWLKNLFEEEFNEACFMEFDLSWIKLSSSLAAASAEILQQTTMAESV
ncbi:hypothetical protein EV356DRAFT_549880 [Viridothelium virens]|uniref:Uncharacterized protein n=1 Tax=Viridothelium virens TaxID=1048519 RepID=A0A6A6GRJ7_VIRVR|nr:hypothetical protein EV356DRAFT_549880 [Viridothelium virens]